MWMIIEDSEESGFYKLAKEYYKDCMSVSVVHADGNGRLEGKYNEVAKGDYALLYIDVIPDNLVTLRLYNNLKKAFRKNHKVLIVPLVCSEFYLLSAFTGYRENLWDMLEREYPVSSQELIMSSGALNAEDYYKKLLSRIDDCMIPDKRAIGRVGKYYTGDCNCTCSLTNVSKLSLHTKACQFMLRLPLRISLGDVTGVSKAEACDIVNKLDAEFDKLMRKFITDRNVPISNIYTISGRKQIFH